MAAYYFLIAQLPSISYNSPPPMQSSAFMDLCKTKLSMEDAKFLDWCVRDPLDGGTVNVPFIDSWRNWERTLRLQLARFRKEKLKREDVGVEPPEHPADAVAVAKAAAGIESPLEAELFLDEARWRAIEVFQGIDYFNENVIYAYLLKLRLLERKALFKAEEGFNEYKTLYAAVAKESEK
ncbi:MAG: hypothetical protein LBG05_02780 [Treponema sp.]|jgi:hypothetical protein|nr:hypothetical protein [Treponema sp.]